MVSFEEEYPSLRNCVVDAGDVPIGHHLNCIPLQEVEFHCVDKQRVRDLITELEEKINDLHNLDDMGTAIGMRLAVDKLRLLVGDKK